MPTRAGEGAVTDGTFGATLGDDAVPWLQADAAASMGMHRTIAFIVLFFRQ